MNSACGLLAALLIALPSLASAQSAWQLAGQLGTGRTLHTSSLLSTSGEVLVVGGYNDSGYLDSVEIYDPKVKATRQAAPMSTARHSHTAHALPDGDILVVGGYGKTNYLPSVERYNANAATWASVAPMAEARIGHAATMLEDGKLLVAGGYNNGGMVKSVELYDPALDLWSTVAEMSRARARHSATLLEDGSVVLAGGFDGENALDLVERYDPESHLVSVEAPLQSARWFHGASALPDGQVLVVGGQDLAGALRSTEVLDPIRGPGKSGPALDNARTQPSVTLDCDGGIVVSAGFSSDLPVVSSQRLLPAASSFSPPENMVVGRLEHTALLLEDCSILALAGRSENTYLTELEVWTEEELPPAASVGDVEGCAVSRSVPDPRTDLTAWAIALLWLGFFVRRSLPRELCNNLF